MPQYISCSKFVCTLYDFTCIVTECRSCCRKCEFRFLFRKLKSKVKPEAEVCEKRVVFFFG